MDIPELISSQDKVQRTNDMQLQQEVYYNFINSIDSEKARSFTSLLKISSSKRTWEFSQWDIQHSCPVQPVVLKLFYTLHASVIGFARFSLMGLVSLWLSHVIYATK
jgi:hypothetical protein